VMPQHFSFPQNAEIWMPRELTPKQISRTAHNWSVVARMRPGVTAQQAYAELSGIAKQLKQEHGKDIDAVDFAVVPQQEYMVGNVRSALVMIFVAVGFLLLVACANVANLLLAQATSRQRDFAVRTALGATRFRLARQFITENVLLVLIAGALGILISFWGVNLLLSLNKQSLPRINDIGVNARVAVFTLGLSLLIGVLLGLVPLFRFSRTDLERTLRESGAGARGYAGQRLRGLLVIGQMALTMVLLVAAGLLGKSFYLLLQVDPGFETESTVAMELSLPNPPMDEARYKTLMKAYDDLRQHGIAPDAKVEFNGEEERQRLFQAQLLERLKATPGVSAVGSISNLPLTGGGPDGMFMIDNNPARKGNAE
jgi:putative ABC transport system permease protein